MTILFINTNNTSSNISEPYRNNIVVDVCIDELTDQVWDTKYNKPWS